MDSKGKQSGTMKGILKQAWKDSKLQKTWEEKFLKVPYNLWALLITMTVLVVGLLITMLLIWVVLDAVGDDDRVPLTIGVLGALFLGTVGLLNLFANYRRTIALEKQLEDQRENINNQREGSKRRDDQYLYATNVRHLGNSSESVRIGGIYGLERLAKESKESKDSDDAWVSKVAEILCAHIRTTTSSGSYSTYNKKKPSSEITTVLSILLHRKDKPFNDLEFDLSGVKLMGANLKGANLARANLENADLTGANLKGANLARANLENADLTGANLKGANLAKANPENADLTEANSEGSNLKNAKLMEAHLEGADLAGSNLKNTKLMRAHLEGADLAKTNLENADLTETNLKDAKLIEVDLRKTDHLKKAILTNVDLTESQLQRTDLSDVDLSGAILNRAHLNGAKLNDANLENADLTGANLEGADLKRANLYEIKVDSKTELAGADLRGAFLFANGKNRPKLSKCKFTANVSKSLTNLKDIYWGTLTPGLEQAIKKDQGTGKYIYQKRYLKGNNVSKRKPTPKDKEYLVGRGNVDKCTWGDIWVLK